MGDPRRDSDAEHIRDLSDLRQLQREHETLQRGSPEWFEHEDREAILTRRIREWDADEGDAS